MPLALLSDRNDPLGQCLRKEGVHSCLIEWLRSVPLTLLSNRNDPLGQCLWHSCLIKMTPWVSVYEIMTLKITLNFLSLWKIFTEEATAMITLKYFILLFKDTEITLKMFKSHWKIVSATHFFCSQDFQRYSRYLVRFSVSGLIEIITRISAFGTLVQIGMTPWISGLALLSNIKCLWPSCPIENTFLGQCLWHSCLIESVFGILVQIEMTTFRAVETAP